MTSALERLDAALTAMSPAETAELDKVLAEELNKPWLPTPGPQLEAYLSEADLLLYGGAAGGGKTDLIVGLATCEHERSVIFRRQSADLDGFWDRLSAVVPSPESSDSNKKRMVTPDGRLIECGHLEKPGSEYSWQGRPHDFIGFDEGAQLSAYKVNFVLGWLRSATGRRCRAVIGSNPPIGGDGAWLMEWFAPWLDPLFDKPAKPGELRWAVTIGNANEIRTVWVDGPEPVEIGDETYLPLSRTFIPSKLDDNPFLKDTKYRAQINSMPEPLRSQLLHGDFLAGRVDDPWQIIPTEWVLLAQERWRKTEGASAAMGVIGIDVAQGGQDSTVYAPLRGVRFDELVERPGKDTPDPIDVVQGAFAIRRNDALMVIDCTGGWGIGVAGHLQTHHEIRAERFIASAASGARTKDGKLGFFNLRAEMWWSLREAFDPENMTGIAIPPDQKLQAQLTAPRWMLKGDRILVESKDDLRQRLGSSTDRADAVGQAWVFRAKAALRRANKAQARTAAVVESDPLAGW